MFVCVCKGVTENDIKQAVNQGQDSVKLIKETLGVASDCGGCVSFAKQIIDQQLVADGNYYQVA